MSRADAKTNLQQRVANLQEKINFMNGVNGTYDFYNPSTLAEENWTGNGYEAWLTEWEASNPTSVDNDHSYPASEDDYTNADHHQNIARVKADFSSVKTATLSTLTTNLTAVQADLDDLIAGEEAGDIDQVDPS
jgi:hypothetical protein